MKEGNAVKASYYDGNALKVIIISIIICDLFIILFTV